jgi:hypothetical protein
MGDHDAAGCRRVAEAQIAKRQTKNSSSTVGDGRFLLLLLLLALFSSPVVDFINSATECDRASAISCETRVRGQELLAHEVESTDTRTRDAQLP